MVEWLHLIHEIHDPFLVLGKGCVRARFVVAECGSVHFNQVELHNYYHSREFINIFVILIVSSLFSLFLQFET